MEAKKQIERHYFDIAREKIDDFPSGDIDDRCESPDFLIRCGSTVIGVEITRIFARPEAGFPVPSQDTERDLIVERAQELARIRGVQNIWVDVLFNPRFLFRRRHREPTASSLVELIAENIPEPPSVGISNWRPKSSMLPTGVDAVSVWQSNVLTSHLWQNGSAGIVNENFGPLLQEKIVEKEPKLSSYLTKCSECWLVVVADWRGPSGFFQMSDETVGQIYRTSFDRVYFLDACLGNVCRLQLDALVR